MGLYSRYILPRLIEAAMQNPELTALRARIVPQAHGRVIEIGIGSALNLPFYGASVSSVTGVDPSGELHSIAQKRLQKSPVPVTVAKQGADEPLPFADSSFDTAVMTWTLCSIPDPLRALRELRRVLRPDGILLFAEHGRAPDSGVAQWQNRLTPVWKRIGGGCHLNRDVPRLLDLADFEIESLETFYIRGPRIVTFMYLGSARVRERMDTTV